MVKPIELHAYNGFKSSYDMGQVLDWPVSLATQGNLQTPTKLQLSLSYVVNLVPSGYVHETVVSCT